MKTKRGISKRKRARTGPAHEKFYPTRAMQAFLDAALDPDVSSTVAATAKAAGIHRRNWSRWKRQADFCRWFENERGENCVTLRWILDKIGLEKARKDFRYWEAMQRKYGGEGAGGNKAGFSVVVRAPRPQRPKSEKRKAKIENGKAKLADEQGMVRVRI